MKKRLILPSLLLVLGTALAEDGDSAKTTASTPEAQGEALAELKGRVDGLNESFLEAKSVVDKLSKIKVSGYVQAQWQQADSNGVGSVAGGNFPPNGKQRFQVRRGRLKTTYETPTSRYVLQFDVVPAGLSLKDAYATVMEPWLKTFSYTMGVFDRPFGFEISYSSSSRESPERSRVFQTLFPGERDLGAKIEIAPPSEMGFAQYLNLKAGAFTGMGPTANEIDNKQDYIGRLGFTAPFYDLNLSVDGGVSAYVGKVTNTTTKVFEVGGPADTLTWKSVAGTAKFDAYDRKIMGVDLQTYYDIPVTGGISLRGEYLWGDQPSNSANAQFYAGDTNGVYKRKINGWYVMAVQNVGSKVQAILKYDEFDPNTQVKGDDIGKPGSKLTAADIKYSTLGVGVLYHWDENVKFTLYYDKVANEKVGPGVTAGSLLPYTKDLKDNVFTLRMQVKF